MPPDDFADDGGGTNGWFRLQRAGDLFNGFWGTDGTNWTLLDTIDTSSDPYGSTLRVGLATWNDSASAFGARFDNFEIDNDPPPPPESFTWTATGGGDWNSSDNWSEDGFPNGSHDAIFAGSIGARQHGIRRYPRKRPLHSIRQHGSLRDCRTGRRQPGGRHDPGTLPASRCSRGHTSFQASVNLLSDATFDIASGTTLIMNNALDLGGNTLTLTGGGELSIRNDFATNGGNLDVQDGIVTGSGTISGNVNIGGGILSPGNSSGTSLASGHSSVPEPNSMAMMVVASLACLMPWRRID